MSKVTPKITIEKSNLSQHIETPITSERSRILTFRKKRWHHKDGIFQVRLNVFLTAGPPPVALRNTSTSNFLSKSFRESNDPKIQKVIFYGKGKSKLCTRQVLTKIHLNCNSKNSYDILVQNWHKNLNLKQTFSFFSLLRKTHPCISRLAPRS